jgi:hypothetical protein
MQFVLELSYKNNILIGGGRCRGIRVDTIRTGVTGAGSNQPTPLISPSRTPITLPKFLIAHGLGPIQVRVTTPGALITHQYNRFRQPYGNIRTNGLRAINKIGARTIKDHQHGLTMQIAAVITVIFLHKTMGKQVGMRILTRIIRVNGETGMGM